MMHLFFIMRVFGSFNLHGDSQNDSGRSLLHNVGCPTCDSANGTNLEIRGASTGAKSTESVRKQTEEPMDAYVIAPAALFARLKTLLDQLGFRAQQVPPVDLKETCGGKPADQQGTQHGCFLAHQGIWSKINKSGRPALVLESDATIGNAPISLVRSQLQAQAQLARTSIDPVYLSVGHCGNMCTTAYFMNPKAGDIGAKIDFCKTGWLVDKQILDLMCSKGVRCTWVRATLQSHCDKCFGDGIFLQDRSLKGLHDPANEGIKPGEKRETSAKANRTKAKEREAGQKERPNGVPSRRASP